MHSGFEATFRESILDYALKLLVVFNDENNGLSLQNA